MPSQLTDAAIRAAKEGTLWDSSLPGFGLRVGKSARTFIVLIASGRRQSIGRYPHITLSEARTEAKRILAEKTLGKVRPVHTAFGDARNSFIEECEQKNRFRTVRDYKRLLGKHYDFGRTSVGDIKPKDILKRLNKLHQTPAEQRYAYVAGRVFFNWCVRQHIIDRSPMENMAVPKAGISRERVLTDEELAKVYRTALKGQTPFYKIVALLCLTAQRKSEIAGLQWSWIDEEEQLVEFPGEITKNKLVHVFPYGDQAQAVLDSVPCFQSPYVFPAARQRTATTTVFNGFSKAKETFDEESGIEGWTLHDLRRTVSSGMAALKVPQTHVERLLNHVSQGTQSPIARIYNRYQYLEEMREAIHKWESHLAALISEA